MTKHTSRETDGLTEVFSIKDQSRVRILQPTEIAMEPSEEREDRKGEEGR